MVMDSFIKGYALNPCCMLDEVFSAPAHRRERGQRFCRDRDKDASHTGRRAHVAVAGGEMLPCFGSMGITLRLVNLEFPRQEGYIFSSDR